MGRELPKKSEFARSAKFANLISSRAQRAQGEATSHDQSYIEVDTNPNVKHQFMALKRLAKLNGYHSPTFGQKYKSRYSLVSIVLLSLCRDVVPI